MSAKPQRIRDPLHNLIEFDSSDFEQMLWQVIQSAPFQRLRRIKQLGFSEMVYPGATHTRFAHSLGTYHIAKQLITFMQKDTHGQRDGPQAQHVKTAALVHDLGHGPFSHAFEEVGKKLNLKMASHESVGQAIILGTEVGDILNKFGEAGFKDNVANVIKAGSARKFGAIVSSQFDADRLDYMQRDRFMSGTQLSGIDFKWLLANMEVADIPWGPEEAQEGIRQSFVLGQKAFYAAEAYVLSLFQLYPTIYYHKATRGAEKLFTELLLRFFCLVHDKSEKKTCLPSAHPLIKFAKKPGNLDCALALDDTVIWGALSMLAESRDPLLANAAKRLQTRNLYKCIDVGNYLVLHLDDPADTGKRLLVQESIKQKAAEWSENRSKDIPRILVDEGERNPYKKMDEEKGLINQILIRDCSGTIVDLAKASAVVSELKPFTFCRFYTASDDAEAKQFIEQEMRGALQ